MTTFGSALDEALGSCYRRVADFVPHLAQSDVGVGVEARVYIERGRVERTIARVRGGRPMAASI